MSWDGAVTRNNAPGPLAAAALTHTRLGNITQRLYEVIATEQLRLNATCRDKAMLLAFASRIGGLCLTAPCVRDVNRIADLEWALASQLQLGHAATCQHKPVKETGQIKEACGQLADALGDHSLTCGIGPFRLGVPCDSLRALLR